MKLPNSWADVSIDKFIQYYTIQTSNIKDSIDLNVRIIALFADVLPEDVERLTTKEILNYAKKLSFLKDMPKGKIPISFKLKGRVYKTTILMADMTAAQFMNFGDIVKNVKKEDYIYHIADLLGCMCIKRERGIFFENGKVSFTRYRYTGYKDNSEVFYKHMSIEQAYPIFVFFCDFLTKLQDYTLASLNKMEEKKLKKSKKEIKKKHSRSIGTGLRSWMRYRITT